MTNQAAEVAKRRTFAIISHPDAGKTTITEKLLLMGKAIAVAGTVKSRKSDRHATSTGWKWKSNGVFPVPRRSCSSRIAIT